MKKKLWYHIMTWLCAHYIEAQNIIKLCESSQCWPVVKKKFTGITLKIYMHKMWCLDTIFFLCVKVTIAEFLVVKTLFIQGVVNKVMKDEDDVKKKILKIAARFSFLMVNDLSKIYLMILIYLKLCSQWITFQFV